MSISDDLVKRLRDRETRREFDDWGIMDEAANLIEALTAERDDQKIARLEAVKSWVNAEARVKELEGQLQSMSILAMELAVEATQEEARVKGLEGLVKRAKLLIDPCYPKKHADWQNDARRGLDKG